MSFRPFLRGVLSSSASTAFDADADAYITAVETADGAALESGVKTAINDFVVGCKADGIWDALKASCILAGARTLNGCLVPLVGTAPTNFNFVSGDYNRKTGLKGNVSTKYLVANRLDSDDPQDNLHFSVFMSDAGPTGDDRPHISTAATSSQLNEIISRSDGRLIFRNRTISPERLLANPAGEGTGFFGSSRSTGAEFASRSAGSSATTTAESVATYDSEWNIFRRTGSSFYSSARLSFYSIGESLDLAALDARVSTLMTEIDGAIA